MRRFITLYMTVNWHREFAVNFATFLKVCRDFFTFAPWFSYSLSHHPLTGTKLYCMVTEAHACEQLAKSITWQCTGQELNQQPCCHQSGMLP